MAAVTVNSFTDNVSGSRRQRLYNITIATSGDTLAVGIGTPISATSNDVAITKLGVSGSTITFTTTGAVTGALVNVIC